MILEAEPSAVRWYNDTSASLGVTFTEDGLVHETTYNGAGYVEYQLVRKAQNDPTPFYQTGVNVNDFDATNAAILSYDTLTPLTPSAARLFYRIERPIRFTAMPMGMARATTSYSYDWYDDSFQVKQVTTTFPDVTAARGGIASAKVWYGSDGKPVWSMNELGRVTYRQYDTVTGRLSWTIEDIDVATSGRSDPKSRNSRAGLGF